MNRIAMNALSRTLQKKLAAAGSEVGKLAAEHALLVERSRSGKDYVVTLRGAIDNEVYFTTKAPADYIALEDAYRFLCLN